jgi:hypothetical protein
MFFDEALLVSDAVYCSSVEWEKTPNRLVRLTAPCFLEVTSSKRTSCTVLYMINEPLLAEFILHSVSLMVKDSPLTLLQRHRELDRRVGEGHVARSRLQEAQH